MIPRICRGLGHRRRAINDGIDSISHHYHCCQKFRRFATNAAKQQKSPPTNTKIATTTKPATTVNKAAATSSVSSKASRSSSYIPSNPVIVDPSSPPYDPNDPIFKYQDPYNLHTPSRLHAMAEKYKWVNWDRFADHIHSTDIHFFDEEVKYVDENYDLSANLTETDELHRQEELKRREDLDVIKFFRLLPFVSIIDSGSTARVTRYGKVRSSWILMLAGDGCGTATFGFGKGEDSQQAIERAEKDCQKNVTFLPLFESRTLLYEVIGKFGVCEVHMRPLARGAGMTAGIIPRLVFEAFGIYDINASVVGRHLPKHQLLACWQGLTRQRSLRELGIARGVNPYKLFERGIQQPRTPPRAILEERAIEIQRKLKEVLLMAEADNSEEHLESIVKNDPFQQEQEEVDRMKAMPPIPGLHLLQDGDKLPDGFTMDDVHDRTDWREAEDRDSKQWGAWAKPGNYVPVLPRRKPHIPTPKPANHQGSHKYMLAKKRT